VRAPTCVIHGSVDPLIFPAGGRATARAVRGARLEVIDGMGHDLPEAAWTRIADAIAATAALGS
jgi:pimeloyl-ACP methyl ester carboxylesterase